jgi:hypothetical protein
LFFHTVTWGNRKGKGIDESKTAVRRAKHGQSVAMLLISVNSGVAALVIFLMQFYGATFPIFVMTYTLVLSATFALSFLDLTYRFFTCQHCFNSTSNDEVIADDDDGTDSTLFACVPACGADDSGDLSDDKAEVCDVVSDTDESTAAAPDDNTTTTRRDPMAEEEAIATQSNADIPVVNVFHDLEVGFLGEVVDRRQGCKL